MRARRVALVVGQLQMGGAERQLYELAVRLDRGRYEPFVVCLSEVSEPFATLLRGAGVPVEVLCRSGHRDAGRVRRLARLLAVREAALVHSFLLAANAYTWAATRLARLWGRTSPYIASSRTCIPPPGRLARAVHARAFRSARAIVANSRRVMEFTRDLYGVDEGLFRVIPNGVDLRAFPLEAAERGAARAAARRDLGLPDDGPAIGCVGRLSPEKNPTLFLEMAARVAAGAGTARFVLIGDGPQRPALLDQVDRLGLGRVCALAGARPDVARLMPALDLLVSPSDTEGMPNAVMEAMAAGLPVVATRVGGTEEVVEDGVTGWLVDRGDLDGLTDRVARLLSDAGSRGAMGARGRRRIEREFTVERMVSATIALYDEAL